MKTMPKLKKVMKTLCKYDHTAYMQKRRGGGLNKLKVWKGREEAYKKEYNRRYYASRCKTLESRKRKLTFSSSSNKAHYGELFLELRPQTDIGVLTEGEGSSSTS